eukprot:m.26964 g.26964  ORF g.26964 m.26964 type:complete len:489 (-) comp9309_c0_seq1:1083-2549(-)
MSSYKRAKLKAKEEKEKEESPDHYKVVASLVNEEGEETSYNIEIPSDVTPEQLQLLCESVIETNEDEEPTPYSFYVENNEVTKTLYHAIKTAGLSSEDTVKIVYQPQAVFRVRGIAECCGTISGHTDNIVDVQFSPDGQRLATGSGDQTVRFWDMFTATPKKTCKGHKNWVQCVAWSPDGQYVASGSSDTQVRVWNADQASIACKPLKGHKKYVTWISWEPMHCCKHKVANRLVSSSADGTVKVWDVSLGRQTMSLSNHSKPVKCVLWGGGGFIYTASQDTTIKVWRASDGALCRTLKGHAHWVNSLSLNVDSALRMGAFNERGVIEGDVIETSLSRYEKLRGEREVLVSASEDHTLILWHPEEDKKPINRLTGHQRPINFVKFSPDGRWILSCSFDKSAKLWNKKGEYITTFRGHVGPVFRCSWAPDSRLVITGSEDSTLKLWNLKSQRLMKDLPGHEGSVFAIDWAPNGSMVASGGADQKLKLWRH